MVEHQASIVPAPAVRAAGLVDIVRSHIDETQDSRRPSPPVMRAFANEGLLRILAPHSYGGEEATGLQFMELVQTVARADGSAGWTVMTLNEEIEISVGYIDAATMTGVCRSSPAVIVAGSGATLGRAQPVDGGFRISGRWPFVTGGPAADEIVIGATVTGPRPRPLCFALVPASQVEICDTWDTVGLRGTGSHDVELHDVFVPTERTGVVATGRHTVPDATLFRMPPALRFPFPKVGVATGIARAAIDAFADLAQAKKARVSRTLLRDRPDAQLAMADAEALVGAGWFFAAEMVETIWDLAERGDRVPPDVHARTRLACSHAVSNCVQAVETLCTAAGTTANMRGSTLQRCLADVRAVSQHVMVGGFHRLDAGRVLLGLDAEDPLF